MCEYVFVLVKVLVYLLYVQTCVCTVCTHPSMHAWPVVITANEWHCFCSTCSLPLWTQRFVSQFSSLLLAKEKLVSLKQELHQKMYEMMLIGVSSAHIAVFFAIAVTT